MQKYFWIWQPNEFELNTESSATQREDREDFGFNNRAEAEKRKEKEASWEKYAWHNLYTLIFYFPPASVKPSGRWKDESDWMTLQKSSGCSCSINLVAEPRPRPLAFHNEIICLTDLVWASVLFPHSDSRSLRVEEKRRPGVISLEAAERPFSANRTILQRLEEASAD